MTYAPRVTARRSSCARDVVVRRRISSNNVGPFESLEGRVLMSVSQDAGGWTVVGKSADSNVIYVSSSGGSDSNDGRSEASPVKTISKGRSMLRNGMPDQLLLKRGDQWYESLSNGKWNLSGRDADEPMLISSYGSESLPRPVLKTGANVAMDLGGGSIHDLVIKGVHFQAHTRIPGGSEYTGNAGAYGLRLIGTPTRLTLEDNLVEFYQQNVTIMNGTTRPADVQVRRNVIADSYPTTASVKSQGMYVENVDGITIEGNLFDHNGWNEQVGYATASIYNHNLYMQSGSTGVVVRDNVFADASSHGLQARSGGEVRNNLFLRNPIGMSFGLVNGAKAHVGGVSGSVDGNVFLDSRDLNGSSRGIGLEMTNIRPGAGAKVRNNIFANDTRGNHAAIKLDVGNDVYNAGSAVGVNDVTVESNIVYDWFQGFYTASGFIPGGTGLTALNNVTVRGNDFQQVRSSRLVRHEGTLSTSEETWSGNRYADSTASSSGWFEVKGSGRSFDNWRSTVESSAQAAGGAYADPDRTIASYMSSIGGSASLDGFLAGARNQRQGSVNGAYTSAAVINYVRRGFAENGVTPGGELIVPGSSTPIVSPTPTPTPAPVPTPTPTPVPTPTPTPTPTPSPSGALRIDVAGGPTTDAAGQVWTVDAGSVGGGVNTGTFSVAGTTDDALFSTRRTGNFSYANAVPNGSYNLRLLFADYYTPGQRVFNVTAEGQQVLTNLDITAEAGKNAALVKTVPVTVADGKLDLSFQGVVGNAAVSGFELVPTTAATPTPTPVPTPTPEPTPTPVVSIPKVPSGLAAKAVSSSQIALSFTDRASNESGFTLQRSTDNRTWTTVATLAANPGAESKVNYTDTGRSASTTYYYRVASFNDAGQSSFATVASTKTLR